MTTQEQIDDLLERMRALNIHQWRRALKKNQDLLPVFSRIVEAAEKELP